MKVNHMLSKSEVTDTKVFPMSHFSLTCDLASWLLKVISVQLMRLSALVTLKAYSGVAC